MATQFVRPDLRAIDDVGPSLVACAIFADERPFGGLAGLIDWRLAGRLSALAMKGFLTGEHGEATLVPGRPRLVSDLVVLFGAGPRAEFDEERFRGVLRHMVLVIEGLRVRRAAIELPGRSDDSFGAERAAELLLDVTSGTVPFGLWLVETDERAAPIRARIERELHRLRRM